MCVCVVAVAVPVFQFPVSTRLTGISRIKRGRCMIKVQTTTKRGNRTLEKLFFLVSDKTNKFISTLLSCVHSKIMGERRMRAKNNRAINGEKNQEFRESDALLVFPSFHFFVSWVGKTCVCVGVLSAEAVKSVSLHSPFSPIFLDFFLSPVHMCMCHTSTQLLPEGKKVPKSTKNLSKSEM